MYWEFRTINAERAAHFDTATRAAAAAAAEVASSKVETLINAEPDYFPIYTHEGKWRHGKESWTNWCEGFLGGQMWIFDRIGLPGWRARAEHYTQLVANRQWDRDVHDLGFVLAPTWGAWWNATRDESCRDVVVQGGRTMSLRFNPKGRFLRSFLAPDSNFIDIMMNVGIVAVAAQVTADPDLAAIAEAHCSTTRKYLVRGDGSVSHEGIHDLATGEFLRQTTQQGWRNDSSWARGLAWSMYGFSSMYALTGDQRWLATAELNAEFWLTHTKDDPIPPNDFDEPTPAREWETSAAACAAGGLLMLAQLAVDTERAAMYRDHAERTILRLCEPDFLALEPGWDGILKHGSYHERKGLGVDESVMWGDYFFVEALGRILEQP